MNPNKEKQRYEDDNSSNTRRIRRGPNRGRATMPEPDNVVSAIPVSAPTFRAMAVQNRGPQLIVPPTPIVAKNIPLVRSPYYGDEQKRKSAEQQPQEQLILNTETQPCLGWNISQIRIQNLPMYFPRNMILWEFSPQDLPDVLERISKHLRDSSVQASYSEEPLSAKLQTCRENAELYLVFFNEPSGAVSMSVQRHKGDHVAANQCIRRLVAAAKGVLGEDDNDRNNTDDLDTALNANAVLAMERLIERCAAESAAAQNKSQDDSQNEQHHPFLNQTPEQMTESAVQDVYGWLEQSDRLDLRRQAFECLLAMTDLKRTLSSTAIATSQIVLQGKVPSSESSELNSHAQRIQSILLSVLLTRELPGDSAMFSEAMSKDSSNNNVDMDLEMRPYFPDADKDVTTASIGLPQYYTDYMNGLFNLALQVFVQSLEVMACFPEPHSNVGDNLTKLLFATSSQDVDGKDIYHMLLNCVGRAESKLANGYLACKALRLLASNHPGIKDQIKFDNNARQSIGNAYQIGGTRHKLLKDQSYQLWQYVCQ